VDVAAGGDAATSASTRGLVYYLQMHGYYKDCWPQSHLTQTLLPGTSPVPGEDGELRQPYSVMAVVTIAKELASTGSGLDQSAVG
jgi:hypothetical protein